MGSRFRQWCWWRWFSPRWPQRRVVITALGVTGLVLPNRADNSRPRREGGDPLNGTLSPAGTPAVEREDSVSWLVASGSVLLHTVVKSVLLFVTAVVGFRIGERRTLAELAAFDFVAVIGVGAIIGRTATAADSAFLTGGVALAMILLTHRLITRLRHRPAFARLVDQQLRLLVVNGELRHDELRKTGLTEADVLAVLRQRGVHRLADVRYLVYEAKGAFSVVAPEAPADGEPLATALRTAPRRRTREE